LPNNSRAINESIAKKITDRYNVCIDIKHPSYYNDGILIVINVINPINVSVHYDRQSVMIFDSCSQPVEIISEYCITVTRYDPDHNKLDFNKYELNNATCLDDLFNNLDKKLEYKR